MYLGIDIGTSSVKAVFTDGIRRASAQAAYPANRELMEQDPRSVEEAVCRVLTELKERSGPGFRICGIGLCGHGPSILFADGNTNPLTPIITWQDKRGREEAGRLRSVYEGFLKDGTSYEAKILWFFRHHPELFDEKVRVLYPKDYIIARLTGQMVIDRSAASTSIFFDRETGSWISDGVDIPEWVFPEVFGSDAVVGETGTQFSRACGLPDGVPVVCGGIDAFCEVLGAGAVSPGDMVDGTGTSTCLSVCVESRQAMEQHVIEGLALLIRQISFTGGSVNWWRAVVGAQDVGAMGKGIDPRNPVKLLFLPYLIGERSPVWDEQASGVFAGLLSTMTGDDLLMGILQGTAYAVRQNLELIDKERSSDTPIRAVGGGAANEQWLQIKADVTGRDYLRMKIRDAASLGAAMLAAAGNEHAPLGQITEDWAKCDRVFEPDPKASIVHQGLYEQYKTLYPLLKETFRQLSATASFLNGEDHR